MLDFLNARARLDGETVRRAAAPDGILPERLIGCADRDELLRRLATEPDLVHAALVVGPEETFQGKAEILSLERPLPERIQVRVRSDAPRVLVLPESDDGGWSADSGGQPVPTLLVDGAFLGIRVPAGTGSSAATCRQDFGRARLGGRRALRRLRRRALREGRASLRERLVRAYRRATAATGPLPPGGRDYKAAWNHAARENAQDAILTGSTQESFEAMARDDAERVRKFLHGDDVVLNIGCGIGRVDLYVAQLVKELWAIDVSGEMIARAKQRLRECPNVRLLEVGNQDFLGAFGSRSVDLVFSYLVLQHLEKEDAVRYMRDVVRVLKPGGAFVTQFPNYLSPEYGRVLVQESEVPVRSPGRVRPYTEAEIRHTLGVLGFEIVELALAGGREGNAEMYLVARTRA
jgi:ubiquinone/menaquinone biosynthesis C-methylase UbiE